MCLSSCARSHADSVYGSMRPSDVRDYAMRWFLLLVSLAAFSFAYMAKTPEMLGIAVLVGTLSLIGSFLGFAQAKISATARPDAAMLGDKDIAMLRNAMREAKKNPPSPPKA